MSIKGPWNKRAIVQMYYTAFRLTHSNRTPTPDNATIWEFGNNFLQDFQDLEATLGCTIPMLDSLVSIANYLLVDRQQLW